MYTDYIFLVRHADDDHKSSRNILVKYNVQPSYKFAFVGLPSKYKHLLMQSWNTWNPIF